MISDTDNIRKICQSIRSRVLMNNVVSKDVETFENEIEENLTNKGIASETDNKEPCGACLLETETGPVSKTGLKMFSKTETVSENKDQVCVA